MTTLSLSRNQITVTKPGPSRLQRITRRKAIWIALLAIGYWFATPYYLPWTAAEEASADARAIASQGSLSRQLAMPCLAALALYMLWRSRPLPKMRGYLFNAGILYLIAIFMSVGWSVDPAISVRRLVVFSMDVLLMTALARSFSMIDIARIGFFIPAFAATFAFVVDLLVTRSFAPLDPNYRLMGIMSSNYMGENLVLCIFSGLTLLLQDKKRGRWLVPSLFAAAALLFITRSRTATIACLLFSSFIFRRLLQRRFNIQSRVLAVVLIAGLALPLVIARGNLEETLTNGFMMGREDTQNTASLSNRAPLWKEIFEYIDKRPYLGYGFRAFWVPERIDIISGHQKWPVPNGHNTYIDEYVSTGIAGAPLFMFIFWGGLFVAWRRYIQVPIAERLFPAVVISWLFFTSWFEAIPPDPFLPTTIGYVCILKSMLPPAQPSEAELREPALAKVRARLAALRPRRKTPVAATARQSS